MPTRNPKKLISLSKSNKNFPLLKVKLSKIYSSKYGNQKDFLKMLQLIRKRKLRNKQLNNRKKVPKQLKSRNSTLKTFLNWLVERWSHHWTQNKFWMQETNNLDKLSWLDSHQNLTDIFILVTQKLWGSTSCRRRCQEANATLDSMIPTHWRRTFNTSKTSSKTLNLWVTNLGKLLMPATTLISFTNLLFN